MRKKQQKTPRTPKKKKFTVGRFLAFICIFTILAGVGGVFYLRNYYPGIYQKILNRISSKKINSAYESQRIERILSLYKGKVFGCDLSHYQEREEIDWDSLYIQNKQLKFPIKFTIFRATMGNEATDKNFNHFWQEAKRQNLIRGAYHYYRPDEDPKLQAASYLRNTNLQKGDFLPILDVEKLPKQKSLEQFIADIQTWMDIVEKKYKRKPILYTYISFYEDYLYYHFKEYPLWVANYNNVAVPTSLFDWKIWQFTENGITAGAKVKIDFNVFNGDENDLKELLID